MMCDVEYDVVTSNRQTSHPPSRLSPPAGAKYGPVPYLTLALTRVGGSTLIKINYFRLKR